MLGESEWRFKVVAKDTIKCPACGSEGFEIKFIIYNIPYFEDVLMEVGKCRVCGYRWTDVGLLGMDRPKRIRVKVEKPSDLNALVIKAAPALVKIPELGIEIYPGPAAPGYITTIEGVLHRVLDRVPAECFVSSSRCYEKVKMIEEASKGGIKFTLIIEDPSGRSDVRGEGVSVEVEELSEDEIERIVKGVN